MTYDQELVLACKGDRVLAERVKDVLANLGPAGAFNFAIVALRAKLGDDYSTGTPPRWRLGWDETYKPPELTEFTGR